MKPTRISALVVSFLLMLLNGITILLGFYLQQQRTDFDIFGQRNVFIVACSLIAIGSISLFFAIFSLLFVLCNSKGLVKACAVITGIMCIFFGVGSGLLFYYKSTLVAVSSNKVDETIRGQYGYDKTKTDAWDRIQIEYKCCGVEEPLDIENFMYFNDKNHTSSGKFPDSCCLRNQDSQFVNHKACTIDKEPESQYQQGCLKELSNLVNKVCTAAAVFMAIISVIYALECIFLIFARQTDATLV